MGEAFYPNSGGFNCNICNHLGFLRPSFCHWVLEVENKQAIHLLTIRSERRSFSTTLTMEEPSWLESTRGYIDLSMLDEAWNTLDALPDDKKSSAPAMEMRIIIRLNQKNLGDALTLCMDLCRDFPEKHAGYIQGAYCLHELDRTEEAQEHLQSGPASLRQEPVYFYNLCCYDLCLGKEDSAIAWINRAFEMSPGYAEEALKDPDLQVIAHLIERKLRGME